MTTHYQDELDPVEDELSIDELITIGMHSDSKTVQEAFKRLEFVIKLAHTTEELNTFNRQVPAYRVRIGIPVHTKNERTYQYLNLTVQGNKLSVEHERYEVCGSLKKAKENIFYMGSIE